MDRIRVATVRVLRWLQDVATSFFRWLRRAVHWPMTFVRRWHNVIAKHERLTEEAFRKLPKPPRRRSLLRSRRLIAMAAAGSRLAGILGLVFPATFTIGWLYQAGRLAGYGVPFSLVTPDPVQLATFAITFSVAAFVAVALYAALYAAAARTSVNIRAALIIASTPVGLALFAYSYVDFDTFVGMGLVFGLVLGAIYIGPYVSLIVEPRELGILLAAILLLGSFPAGWVMATRKPPDISGDRVTLTLNEKVSGVPGTRVGGACVYEDVELVQVDSNWLIFRRHGNRSAWVVPISNVTSIGVRQADLNGPSC